MIGRTGQCVVLFEFVTKRATKNWKSMSFAPLLEPQKERRSIGAIAFPCVNKTGCECARERGGRSEEKRTEDHETNTITTIIALHRNQRTKLCYKLKNKDGQGKTFIQERTRRGRRVTFCFSFMLCHCYGKNILFLECFTHCIFDTDHCFITCERFRAPFLFRFHFNYTLCIDQPLYRFYTHPLF